MHTRNGSRDISVSSVNLKKLESREKLNVFCAQDAGHCAKV